MVIMQRQQNNQQKRKATKPQSAELSEQAIRNLVGFFDVLIQMDFAHKQRNERNDENGLDFQDATSVVKKADWPAYDSLVMGW